MEKEYITIRLSSSKTAYHPSKRYLLWCDENWYETTNTPTFVFAANDIEDVKKQLVKHYIYRVAFVYPNGKEVIWDYFNNHKTANVETKGLTFMIKM